MSKYSDNLSKQLLDCIADENSNFSIEDASRLLSLMDEMDIQDYISNEIMECSGVDMPVYYEILKAIKKLKKYKKETELPPVEDTIESGE